MNRLVTDLAAAIGAAHVLTDPELVAGYTTDWTRRYAGTAECVARPGTTAEVAEVVSICARHQVPIVPQGGNTGLVGASVPFAGGVVLSTRRLRRLDDGHVRDQRRRRDPHLARVLGHAHRPRLLEGQPCPR